MNHLMHLTINTAHYMMYPLEPLPKAVAQALLPLVQNGGGKLPEPLAEYNFKMNNADKAWIFTVFTSDSYPVLTFGIALDRSSADGLWPIISKVRNEFKSIMPFKVTQPLHLPWLITKLWHASMAIPPHHLYLMANMQQCIASLLIELDVNRGLPLDMIESYR